MPDRADACPGSLPPLLAPDEPGPIEVVHGEEAAPFLIVCDHASRRFPRALGTLGIDGDDELRHIAWDIGAAEVARLLAARFKARLVLATYSRLVVDVNRAPNDPTFIPAISEGTVVPGNRNLTPAAIAQRADALFHPYHGAVAEAMAALKRRGPPPALVSVHSFTPVFKGELRPWHIGVLWDRDGRLALPFMEGMRARPGIRVGDNQPYSGRDHYAYTVDCHARRHGLPDLSIEIRQDLIENAEGVAEWAAIVGDVLAPVLADPGLYRVAKSP
jgi:predicted N-formylglutamate amidohydrolase